MPKCLRCGAGGEWIQGRVPKDTESVRLRELLSEAVEIASDAIAQEGSGWPEGELSYFNKKNRWTERLTAITREIEDAAR